MDEVALPLSVKRKWLNGKARHMAMLKIAAVRTRKASRGNVLADRVQEQKHWIYNLPTVLSQAWISFEFG